MFPSGSKGFSTVRGVGEEAQAQAEKVFNLSSDHFVTIRGTNHFVDKSMLIEYVLKKKMVFICAPNGFGKTTNLTMVKTFVEIEKDRTGNRTSKNIAFFEGLEITKNVEIMDKHFGSHPVIYLNLNNVGGETDEEVKSSFLDAALMAFERHYYLSQSHSLTEREKIISQVWSKMKPKDQDVVIFGLQSLSEYLHKHFRRSVFVLIDGYDSPIFNTALKKSVNLEVVTDYLSDIVGSLLNGNEHVEHCMVTGVLPLTDDSAFKNVEIFAFMRDHEFLPFSGLTDDEVQMLCDRFEVPIDERQEIKKRFGGYFSISERFHIYNMQSVLKWLQEWTASRH